jgi:FecR protein
MTRYCLCCFFLLAALWLCPAVRGGEPGDHPELSTLVRVSGQAWVSSDGVNWQAANEGTYLAPGVIIKTGQNSFADIVLGNQLPSRPLSVNKDKPPGRLSNYDNKVTGYTAYNAVVDQNVVRVNASSVLKIDKLTVNDTGIDTVSDTELDLQAGNIFARVKKISRASQYFIKLPNGVAGVRGTVFSLDANGSCSCYESQNGGVVLSVVDKNNAVQIVTIPAHFTWNSQTDGSITIQSQDNTTLASGGTKSSASNATIQLTPLSPEDEHQLTQFLDGISAYCTLSASINVSDNKNQTYISPVRGGHHHHREN